MNIVNTRTPRFRNIIKGHSCPCSHGNHKHLHMQSAILEDKRTIAKITATSLHKIGHLRLADNKTPVNVYEHFAEPTKPLNANVKTEKYRTSLKDFLDIHDEVLNFGIPETSDLMSGAKNLSATGHEDKCSQCRRLARDVVPRLSINEMLVCLSKMNWWGSEAGQSLALMDIVRALDRVCVDRLQSQHFSLGDQLRLVYQWQSLLFLDNYPASFPAQMLSSLPGPALLQSSLPLLVSWLLLFSSTDPVPGDRNDNEVLADKINTTLKSGGELGLRLLAECELVSCYLGLRTLAPGSEERIACFLKSQFGYRIHDHDAEP